MTLSCKPKPSHSCSSFGACKESLGAPQLCSRKAQSLHMPGGTLMERALLNCRRWQSRSYHRYPFNWQQHSWGSMQICILDLWQIALYEIADLQVTSACACERNWSTYDYIHNKKRNRLDPSRAEKLVYVFSNLRFLKRAHRMNWEEQCWSWEEEA